MNDSAFCVVCGRHANYGPTDDCLNPQCPYMPPAYFDPDGPPAEGGRWRRSARLWLLFGAALIIAASPFVVHIVFGLFRPVGPMVAPFVGALILLAAGAAVIAVALALERKA